MKGMKKKFIRRLTQINADGRLLRLAGFPYPKPLAVRVYRFQPFKTCKSHR